MRLSEHFTLEEMTASAIGAGLKIPNNPNGTQVDCLVALCHNVLEPVRAHFGRPVKILSGFRCGYLNKVVGGSETSQHTKGEAADISIDGIPHAEIWEYVWENLTFDQLIAEKLREEDGAAGWVHVSYSTMKNRKDALSFKGNGVYVRGVEFV